MPGKRIFLATTATAVAVLALSGSASAGGGNDYQGHAERDRSTYVGFDVNGARTKESNFEAILSYHCPGQDDSVHVDATSHAQLKIKDGKFSGTLHGQTAPFRGGPALTYKVSGRLGKHGRASGTVDGSLNITVARGGNSVRCYSGGLDWKAKKGATVVVRNQARKEAL